MLRSVQLSNNTRYVYLTSVLSNELALLLPQNNFNPFDYISDADRTTALEKGAPPPNGPNHRTHAQFSFVAPLRGVCVTFTVDG